MTQLGKSLLLDIYGTYIEVLTNSDELLDRLRKDFSFFLKESLSEKVHFRFEARLEEKQTLTIPRHFNLVRESKNSKTYDYQKERYNDYFGKLISFYNYQSEVGILSSGQLEKLHEVTYLLILSRVGKKMDLDGLHKVHAFGVIYKGVCCLGMMDMGTGKSTLMLQLLKNQDVEILSDDTPLIGKNGVRAFPLRVGLSEKSLDFDFIDREKNLYSLHREEYGIKQLASLDAFENKIGHEYHKLLVLEGFRDGKLEKPRLVKSSRLALWIALQRHMVIGIGLPIIFEYFWEYGFNDFIRKTKIFFLRQVAAIRLARQSKHYKFYMSNNPQENADCLMRELESASN